MKKSILKEMVKTRLKEWEGWGLGDEKSDTLEEDKKWKRLNMLITSYYKDLDETKQVKLIDNLIALAEELRGMKSEF